jgi:deoxyribose-phosphate aldolase
VDPVRVVLMRPEELAGHIDSTILRPEATPDEVAVVCEEAVALGCAAAVVLPLHLDLCVEIVSGSATAPCTVAAFPAGGLTATLLDAEVEDAMDRGATEVDMVMPIGLVRAARYGEVVEYVHGAAGIVHQANGLLKVIVEAGLLGADDLRRAASLAADGGADFVKTSTGVYGGPATVDQVRLLRSSVPPMIGVKASGGISSLADALALLEAGADRLGTSSAAEILSDPSLPA